VKICILTSRFPYPIEKGDKLRIYHQIRILSQWHSISLISICEKTPNPIELEELLKYCSSVHTFPITKWKSKISMFRSLFNKMPFQLSYFYNPVHSRAIKALINELKPDHIYCQLVRMSEYVKDIPIEKTIDYMDAFSKGMQRRSVRSGIVMSLFYKWEARRLEKYEAAIFDYFDKHTVISRQDAEELSHSGKIKVIPNGVDTEYFQSFQSDKTIEIGFIGNLGYLPNKEAVEFIVKQIVPGLKQSIKVLIAGARPPAHILGMNSQRIHVHGWVEDIRQSYSQIKIFVAPLFHGIGQQNKILEAMSMGVPCITNSLVNNAIGAVDRQEVWIADTPTEFIQAIHTLLEDEVLYDRMAKAGIELVKTNFSWEEQVTKLEALIQA
jgi:glycosyltransferase involved in cell wall biosynthesis